MSLEPIPTPVEVRSARARIAGLVRARMNRLEGWQLAVKVVFIVVGGGAAALAEFLPDSKPGEVPWRMLLGVSGASLAVLGGILVAFVERDSARALKEADDAIEMTQGVLSQRQQIIAELGRIRRDFQKYRELYSSVATMREALEQGLPLPGTLELMLRSSLRNLVAAMGFEASERWTLSVYHAVDEGGPLLKHIAGNRGDRTEENKDPRSWRLGEGYAGAAFGRNAELVLADAQEPGVAAMLNVPEANRRPTDGLRYRSVAVIPIRVRGRTGPWGVVIATSDQRGRFDNVSGSAGSAHVEPLRLLSGMIALAAATQHIQRRDGSDKAPLTPPP